MPLIFALSFGCAGNTNIVESPGFVSGPLPFEKAAGKVERKGRFEMSEGKFKMIRGVTEEFVAERVGGGRAGPLQSASFRRILIAAFGLDLGIVGKRCVHEWRVRADAQLPSVGTVGGAISVPRLKNEQIKGDGQRLMRGKVGEGESDGLVHAKMVKARLAGGGNGRSSRCPAWSDPTGTTACWSTSGSG